MYATYTTQHILHYYYIC